MYCGRMLRFWLSECSSSAECYHSQEMLSYFIPHPVSGNYFLVISFPSLLTNKYENVQFLVLNAININE